ncbi:MAG: hypothetical protein AMK69_16970 [Nitrospira bacterium SG8_3]|nr:MAG: hypothetical protein AMK69_16970 [Nitrospira bacterium SG8_3]
MEILVDSSKFWRRLESDLHSAKHDIFIQTLSFEGDKVGKSLSNLLLSKQSCDRRLLVDSYNKFVLSDNFLYTPRNLLNRAIRHEQRQTTLMINNLIRNNVHVKFTNRAGPFMLKFAQRNHKKLILIDDTISYIGGINFSEHNFMWHDMMVRIEDHDVASFLRKDFLSTWTGRNMKRSQQFDGIGCHILDGRSNELAFKEIFRLIDGAKRHLYVESPYITFPFYEKLKQAGKRNVKITVIAPKNCNRSFFNKYTRWEAMRSDFDLRLYEGRMTHLKALLIDDDFLIIGSSNFDYLSYRLHQEILAILTSDEVISTFFEKVIRRDLNNSIKYDGHVSSLSGHLRDLVFKLLADLSILANRIC